MSAWPPYDVKAEIELRQWQEQGCDTLQLIKEPRFGAAKPPPPRRLSACGAAVIRRRERGEAEVNRLQEAKRGQIERIDVRGPVAQDILLSFVIPQTVPTLAGLLYGAWKGNKKCARRLAKIYTKAFLLAGLLKTLPPPPFCARPTPMLMLTLTAEGHRVLLSHRQRRTP